MYVLQKLIALQLLLLCVATKAEDPWSFTAKGGFFFAPKRYAVDENASAEFTVTYVGDKDTYCNWKFDSDSITEQNQTQTTQQPTQLQLKKLNQKIPYIITSTVTFIAHKNMEQFNMSLTKDKYWDLNKKALEKLIIEDFVVQHVDGPEISLVGENVNGNRFMENEQFSLNCSAGGLVNTTIEWVDSAGNTVIPSQVTELGNLMEIPNSDTRNEHSRSWQILNVTAQKEMTSFGCRMKAPNYKSSPFEDTKWFKFTVLRDDRSLVNNTLVNDTLNITCDLTTSDCLNEAAVQVVIDEEPSNIWPIVGPIIAIIAFASICAVFYFGRTYYYNSENAPNNRIYDVVKYHKGNTGNAAKKSLVTEEI